MNVEIGAEAALFPEKEYINGIAVEVWGCQNDCRNCRINHDAMGVSE
jgi:hypothetical protein